MHEAAAAAVAFAPGARVEVLSRFDRSWKRGFVVEAAVAGGYLLRRLSDGAVLPAHFTASELRVEQPVGAW